jgi:hypothetical protein
MKNGMIKLVTIVSLTTLGLAGSAFAATAQISASDQKLSGSQLTITDANLPSAGFLVIQSSDAKGNMTDQSLGYVALSAGDHKSVKINLSGTFKPKDKVWAVLHQDTTSGKFEYTAGKTNMDPPYMENGKAVAAPITLQ